MSMFSGRLFRSPSSDLSLLARPQTLTRVWLEDNKIHFEYSDHRIFIIEDNGQLCCEYRHITTDDDLSSVVGDTIVSVTLEDGPDRSDKYYIHEIQFVKVQTNKTSLTFCTHNEHTGYYSGFSIEVSEIQNPLGAH